jgi:hypothetical protein
MISEVIILRESWTVWIILAVLIALLIRIVINLKDK